MDLKTIILDGQDRVAGYKVIERDIDVDVAAIRSLNKVIAITGPRRAGKTSFMVQLIRKLGISQTEAAFLDFSEIVLFDFTAADFPALYQAYCELYPSSNPWFFLDEIQEVEDFEKGLHYLLNAGAKVFISGSSAKLSSMDLASTLRGKALPIHVYSLNFKEFLRFKKMSVAKHIPSKEMGKRRALFTEFLYWGGFPELVLTESTEMKRALLKSYTDLMLFRDIIERHELKKFHLVEMVYGKLLRSFTKQVSISKWYNDLKSSGQQVSKDTIFQYIGYFEDSQFFSLLENRAGGVTSLKKIYLTDNGLYAPLGSRSPDTGRLFENQIHRDLLREGSPCYFLQKNDNEIDFITGETGYQVCHTLNDDNFDREMKGVCFALNESYIKKVILLYMNDERRLKKSCDIPKRCEMIDYFDKIAF